MVFSNLLGPAKELRRRRSSAASSASGASSGVRPLSASSGRASRNSGKGPIEDDEGDEEEKEKDKDKDRDRGTLPVVDGPPPEYIFDETQLAPVAPEPPDLRDLNHSLDALAVVFPDVQVDVFREMLANFDGESRLALVADALLKNRVTWVKGRWRTATAGGTTAHNNDNNNNNNVDHQPPVPPADRFRTPAYQKAATALACHEFVGLSRSTIHAVLAEHNYAYLDARSALVHLSTKSWRFALSSLFLRRKPVTAGDAENHPLVVWRSSGRGSILPTVKATGSAELDRELYDALVAPLRAQQRQTQEVADRAVAAALNSDEAEAAGAVYECACCFSTAPFEEVVVCGVHGDDDPSSNPDSDTHIICFRCVQLTVREAVFGQGWRCIDPARGTLRCPAARLDRAAAACPGLVPVDQLQRALLADSRTGADVLRHLDRRLADLSLLASGLPLVRCPFCAYAEVDDLYVPTFRDAPLRLRVRGDGLSSMALVLLILFGATPAVLLVFAAVAVACGAGMAVLAVLLPEALPDPLPVVLARVGWAAAPGGWSPVVPSPSAGGSPRFWTDQLEAAVTRFRRRRRGHQFRCQNAAGGCGRVSCLRCGKAWTDIHVCHESSLLRLRTEVEQAMSMAIKRVCPRCHTSFVKTAGCNKLTCPCGYKMCYVCRRDISARTGPDAGYAHFCDHFRPDADPSRPCAQCRKCNLWAPEDTAAVLQAARAEAEQRWRAAEQRELTRAERVYLETGLLRADGGGVGGGVGGGGGGTTVSTVVGVESFAVTWNRVRTAWTTTWATVLAVARAVWTGGDDMGGTTVKDGPHRPTVADALDWLLETVFV